MRDGLPRHELYLDGLQSFRGRCFDGRNWPPVPKRFRLGATVGFGDDPENPWIDSTPPEDICEEFYTLNPQKLECGDYTILVFEDNEELRALGDEINGAK